MSRLWCTVSNSTSLSFSGPHALAASKRGVSEMLSYVLVLVIALALSVGVYAYLQLQAPKQRASCESGVQLTIDPAGTTCTIPVAGGLALTAALENTGRRSIAGAYIRLGPKGTAIRTLVNKENVYFNYIPDSDSTTLLPGATYYFSTTDSRFSALQEGKNVLEVQPFVLAGSQPVICEQATVTQRITCTKEKSPAP